MKCKVINQLTFIAEKSKNDGIDIFYNVYYTSHIVYHFFYCKKVGQSKVIFQMDCEILLLTDLKPALKSVKPFREIKETL